MRHLAPVILLASTLFATGCFPAPDLRTTPPMVDQQSEFDNLSSLAPPKGEPIVVGVYNFTDQTGQRLVTERPVSEMSTALPQGMSSILVQELQRAAGGKLYRVVERENIEALLTERRIVVASLPPEQASQLTPLLVPGIFLTGGAVSYDRNITQNVRGLGFKSVNGVKEVATDQVGVILRAVSVKTGEVLASVHARKSVMSARDGVSGMFILDHDVLAFDVGGSANEPVSLALRMAIAAAVLELTQEGITKGWWSN
jgi:curli production assembly/transport component CsgG